MEGKLLGNRYEILSRVGMGGMAVVYKAKDIMLNRFVAIKILREEYKENEEFIRRFNVESQAAACLSHQNIVQIYDVGEEDGIHYIVMELLEGRTLKEYIKDSNGVLKWREAANISIQICRALDHAHSHHVVHRDIKPQNIIMTEGGKLKVADFGIARAANNSTTVNLNTSAVGSAHYLSPEQARGGYTDHRSDIYSLGIVMYEMFTGKLPFDADTGVSVIMQHLNEEATPPCSVNPEIPRGIEAIIMKAMSKDQRLRYDSAKDILEDLIAVYQNPNIKPSALHIDANDIIGRKNENNRGGQYKKTVNRNERTVRKKKKSSRTNYALRTVGILTVIVAAVLVVSGIYVLMFGTGNEVDVPDLIGLTYEEATEAALEASTRNVVFEVTEDHREHSEFEKDIIISQTPEAGGKVKRSREIKVVISSGPVILEIENYVGQEFEKVRDKLEKDGIKVIASEEDSDIYEEGIITGQNPKEGTELAKGDEITLYVSAGTQNTVVPNVKGKTLDEAIVAIERNNLKVGNVTNEAKDGYSKGVVFKQSKDAFETVSVNTVIDLYVATGEKEENKKEPEQDESETGGNEKESNTAKKKTVNLSLGNLPSDREKVNIRLVADGKTYYEKEFSTAGGSADVSLEITKSLSLDVYYDGVYITTKEVKY